MGLPGSGKTALSSMLAERLRAVLFDGDDVRNEINKDLKFSEKDRIEHAKRMGWLCDQVVKSGNVAIASFICPTIETRNAFLKDGEAFIIWINRNDSGAFKDTSKMFTKPESIDIEVTNYGTPEYWVKEICKKICMVFDSKKPTAFFLGRYQPFHNGHKALIENGIKRVGQVCIGVRNMPLDESNPYDFNYVKSRIDLALREYIGLYSVVQLPNISGIFYGRDVGYIIEKIDLDDKLSLISGTEIRTKERTQ